jgi:hypothetical protein
MPEPTIIHMPIYTPKFKTGETVVRVNKNSNGREQYIVIATIDEIWPYSNHWKKYGEHNNNSPDNTVYLVLNVNSRHFIWYFEYEYEENVYCSNTERGKKILRNYLTVLFNETKIEDVEKQKQFVKRFFGDALTTHQKSDNII